MNSIVEYPCKTTLKCGDPVEIVDGVARRLSVRLVCKVVENIPWQLEPSTLYISKAYQTTIHLCPCGCGEQVVIPTGRGGWALEFDGEKVTLHPSIGNRFACKSHYFIRNNEVIWA